MTESERRYSQTEFASIMEQAAGAQPVAAGRALRRADGLTLAEMQAIAAEVGVAPEAVARSARLLPLRQESEAARLLGGPAVMQLEFTVPEAEDVDPNLVLAAVRRVTSKHGAARRTGAVLEWSSGGSSRSLAVNVAPGERGTMVMILVDRSTDATVLTVMSLVAAGVTVGITGSILEPTGAVAVTGLVLGITGAWAAAARAVWAGSTRRWRRLLARLTTAIGETLEKPRVPSA